MKHDYLKIESDKRAGPFSWEPYTFYMNFMEEKALSTSINYFKQVYDTVEVKVNGRGRDALTPKGQIELASTAEPYMFGVHCGDKYVSSYKQGMMIMYGIYMEFDSMEDKFVPSPPADVSSTLADIQNMVKHRPT